MRSFYRTGASPDLCNKAIILEQIPTFIMQLYRIAANFFVLCAAARHDCLPLSARRRGTFFCVATRKYPKKRRPGAAWNPVPNGPPQEPPNSPLANGAGLRQIGVLRVRIFDSLSTILGQTVCPGSRQRGRVASVRWCLGVGWAKTAGCAHQLHQGQPCAAYPALHKKARSTERALAYRLSGQ